MPRASPATPCQRESWWLVAAEEDWETRSAGETVATLFERIVPFPEAGPNSLHSEILVAAFAQVVFTRSPTAELVVKGVAPSDSILAARSEWKRLVAFRMPGE